MVTSAPKVSEGRRKVGYRRMRQQVRELRRKDDWRPLSTTKSPPASRQGIGETGHPAGPADHPTSIRTSSPRGGTPAPPDGWSPRNARPGRAINHRTNLHARCGTPARAVAGDELRVGVMSAPDDSLRSRRRNLRADP